MNDRYSYIGTLYFDVEEEIKGKVEIRRGPRLEDIPLSKEELEEDEALVAWEERSEARLEYAVLGAPNLDESEMLANVRKYVSGVTGSVFIKNEKENKLKWCFFDPHTQKYYVFKGRDEIYEFNPKTGEEKFLGENRNN